MSKRRIKEILHAYAVGLTSEHLAIESLQKLDWPRTVTCEVCGEVFEPVKKIVKTRRGFCWEHKEFADLVAHPNTTGEK